MDLHRLSAEGSNELNSGRNSIKCMLTEKDGKFGDIGKIIVSLKSA